MKAAGGLYATHMRSYDVHAEKALDEAVHIGRQAEVPVVVSHYLCGGRDHPGVAARSLDWMDAAMKAHDVAFDAYPYVGSSSSLLVEYLPGSERIMVAWSEPHPECAGRDLAAIAADWACSEEDAVRRLAPAGAVYFGRNEADIRAAMARPSMMIGSDGIPLHPRPHPRLWGTFPRVLGHYARDLGLFPLEQAVHRMTGLTARRFGLEDRGVVRAGAFADLVVFNPATVIDRATYENPEVPADGIDLVLVNGQLVCSEGASSPARPGRVLRRSATATEP